MKFGKLAAGLAGLAVVAVTSGCIPGASVQPADGPAATPDVQVQTETAKPSKPAPKPSEEPSDEPTQSGTASFDEKFVYVDGLEVEVTRIKNGKMTAKDVEYTDNHEVGDPYTAFTIRAKNGTSGTLDLFGYAKVSYGPDGDEAEEVYLFKVHSDPMSGKLLKGRSKSGKYVFSIPKKYRGDVVLEFSPTVEHEPAIFTGSVN